MDMISIASPNRFFYGFFSTFLQHQGSAVSSCLLEDAISLEDAIAKTKISGCLEKHPSAGKIAAGSFSRHVGQSIFLIWQKIAG